MLQEQHRNKKIDGLDGLRAIAIIAIIIYHIFPYQVKGGFLGVSLFFVLSGYLMAISSERARREHKYNVIDFYKKRIVRIYPAALTCIFVTAGFFFLLSSQTVKGIFAEIVSIVFGVNNWWQIFQNSSYFTKIANASPYTHLWSLSVELQFYLVWPGIYLWYLFTSKAASKKKVFSYAGFVFLGVLVILSMLLMAVLFRPGADATRVYYGTDTRAYALLLGVLLGMIYNRREFWNRIIGWLRKPSSIIMGVLSTGILAAFIFMDGQGTFTYWGGMQLVTLAFGVVIVIVSDDMTLFGEWLEIRPIAWLGEISYEMYLWMYPVIFIFNIKKWTRLPFSWVLQLMIIIALAAWLHTFTEWLKMGNYSLIGGNMTMKIKKIGFIGCTLVLAVVCVLGGCATLTSGRKNTDSKKLEAELKENAERLEKANEEEEPAEEEAANEEAANEEAANEQAEQEAVDPLEAVVCIGDSVMLGASPAIEEALPDDAIVDAKESRQVSAAQEIVEQLKAEDKLGKTVIIALGTNGPDGLERNGQLLIDAIGTDRNIFWVNVFGKTLQWEDQSNAAINALVEKNENVRLIDWCGAATGNDDWFYQDGIHLKPSGQKEYARVIVEAVKSALS